MDEVRHGRPTRLRLLVEALPLVALAVWTRTRSAPLVFVRDAVLPLDTDCHYHLRRSLRTLEHFPSVPLHDPLLGWPGGGDATWPPGFDQLCALPAWLLGLRGDTLGASRVIACVPVALGVAIVLGVRALTARLLGDLRGARATAWAAALLAAVLPQCVEMTELGRTDHHGAEALLALWLATWTLGQGEEVSRRDATRWELAGAALFAAAIHVYCGAVLFAGVAVAARAARNVLWGVPEVSRAPPFVGSGGIAALGASALLLVVDGAWIARHGLWFHPLQLSLLQPALLVAAGLFSLVVAWRVRGPDLSSRARALAAIAAGGAAVGLVAAALLPGARAAFVHGLVGWLAHRDPWMDRIIEVRPLFDERPPWRWSSWALPRSLAGLAAVATLALLPLALWRSARVDPRRAWYFGVHAVALLLLATIQLRFARPLLPLLAAWTAVGLAALGTLAARALRTSEHRGIAGALLAGVAALTCLDPVVRATWWTRAHRAPLTPIHEVALFLRAQRVAPLPGRGAGVLTPWGRAFEVIHVATRPTIVSGFGPYLDPATFAGTVRAWRSDGDAMNRWMDLHDAGHLVAGVGLGLELPVTYRPLSSLDPAFLRGHPNATLWLNGSGGAAAGVPHQAHFLPVFASTQRVESATIAVPMLWVYERVRGARLVGEAPRGTRVKATIPMFVRGATRRWMAWADARDDGRFELVVPLPTRFETSTIATGAAYTLHVGEAWSTAVTVSTADVREGRVIEVRPGPPGAP